MGPRDGIASKTHSLKNTENSNLKTLIYQSQKSFDKIKNIKYRNIMEQERNDRQEFADNLIAITDQNRHLISDSLGGIIVLPNGTIKLTPQFLTKQKNPNIQRMKKYPTRPTQTPECVRTLDGHPQPSDLNLIWTHDGEWAKIPIERNARLHEDTPHEIVRVESYIDEEGVIRKAVSYGRIDLQLEVWYRYGDIQQYYPNWEIHKPSLFYNGKRWREDVPHYLNKAKKAKNVQNNQKKPPKASTSKDIIANEGTSGSRT